MPALPLYAFRDVRRTRASGEIILQLRDLMASGRLKLGDRLPSEREFAQILGVGRSTVREAIRAMESLELVEVRAGEGTFLAAPETDRQHDALPASLFGDRGTQAKMFEVRKVLEPGLAALAARRISFPQLEKMRTTLAEQEAGLRRGERCAPEDGAFHLLISEAAGNEILTRILEGLLHILRRGQERLPPPTRVADGLLREEWGILRAVEGRNPRAAQHRMQAHLCSVERLLFSTNGPAARPPTAPTPSA